MVKLRKNTTSKTWYDKATWIAQAVVVWIFIPLIVFLLINMLFFR